MVGFIISYEQSAHLANMLTTVAPAARNRSRSAMFMESTTDHVDDVQSASCIIVLAGIASTVSDSLRKSSSLTDGVEVRISSLTIVWCCQLSKDFKVFHEEFTASLSCFGCRCSFVRWCTRYRWKLKRIADENNLNTNPKFTKSHHFKF